jgi:hypothetical protein
MKPVRDKLSYANIVSTICLFLLLGGGAAYAASHLGKNSIGTKQLKKNAVTTAKIKNEAVTTEKIKNGSVTSGKLANGSVGGAQLQANSISGGNVQAGSLTGANINQATLTSVRASNVTGIALSENCQPLVPLPSGVSATTDGDGCKLTFPTSVYDCTATATVALRTIALVFAAERTVQTQRNPTGPDVIDTFPYEEGHPTAEPVDLTLVC